MAQIEIDERLPYRIGSRLLPVLPVETRPLFNFEEKFPNAINHLQTIVEMLGDYGMSTASTDVAYRLHTDVENSDEYITITVVSEFRPGCLQSWKDAVTRIRSYLSGFNINYAVEIIDLAAYRGLQTWPFSSDIYNWNQVLLPLVQSFVEDRQWITIDMVYREHIEGRQEGEESLSFQPTILFTARDADESHWWEDTLPGLKNALQQYPEIQIEILYLRQFITTGTDPDRYCLRQTCLDATPLGASCGCEGQPRTGTLGGGVTLKVNGGTTVDLGITNHHVLANELDSGGPFTSFPKDIKVECPSQADHSRLLEHLGQDISHETHNVGDSDQLSTLKNAKRRVEHFDRVIGTVYATSGFRTCQNESFSGEMSEAWALDWGLTTVVKPKSVNSLTVAPSGSWAIHKYCQIHPNQGYRVFKCGRTSGTTLGYISATKGVIRVRAPEPEHGLTVDVVKLDKFSQPVRCHTMIKAVSKFEQRRIPTEFIEPGDSGSLVLLDPKDFSFGQEEETAKGVKMGGKPANPDINDWGPFCTAGMSTGTETNFDEKKEAYIAGLAFGGNGAQLLSYMMPMDLVVKDIEVVTGGTVIKPENAGSVPKQCTETKQKLAELELT